MTNSAYTTFQTDKPVTYLVRISYAAAADLATNTSLGNLASVGTGATAFNANNAYMNRNSDAAYDDRPKGVDAQIYLNFTDSLSTVITYIHLVQAVTGGFKLVD